jgi:hypothetical protein
MLGSYQNVGYKELEFLEFQGDTKVLLAEKYSFVLQQRSHLLRSKNCQKGIEFEIVI